MENRREEGQKAFVADYSDVALPWHVMPIHSLEVRKEHDYFRTHIHL
jgi:hypothetical protein